MSSIISALRKVFGNRRRGVRLKANLTASVSVLSADARLINARWGPQLQGHTHDLSSTHLSVVVPSIRIGSRYLTARDSKLLISLQLPDEQVQIEGTPVRYDKLTEEGAGQPGHLIIAKIRRISEAHRSIYSGYLRTLS